MTYSAQIKESNASFYFNLTPQRINEIANYTRNCAKTCDWQIKYSWTAALFQWLSIVATRNRFHFCFSTRVRQRFRLILQGEGPFALSFDVIGRGVVNIILETVFQGVDIFGSQCQNRFRPVSQGTKEAFIDY